MEDKAQLKQFYDANVAALTAEIAALKLRNRIFVCAELVTFIAAVGCLTAYTVYGNTWLTVAAAAMGAAYMAARRMDVNNSEHIDRLTARLTVYRNELGYLANDFSPFDDGRRYADPQHPFTFDMDIFGPQSLFHRINRTVTTGGSDELARCLSDVACCKTGIKAVSGDEMGQNRAKEPVRKEQDCNIPAMEWAKNNNSDKSDDNNFATLRNDGMAKNETDEETTANRISHRRATIDRLAGMERLRTDFIACRHHGRIDTAAVKSAISAVRAMQMPRWAGSATAAIVAWLSIAGFATTVLLSVFTPMPSAVPTIWGTLHLFIQLMICNKPLRAIDKTAGRLSRELTAYNELLSISEELVSKKEKESLGKSGVLISILKGIDRRGNILGMILFDVFLLSDFFLVRRFRRWQQQGTDRLEQSIDKVSYMDALISMATFRYNEPHAGTADIVTSEDVVYDARGLWHPFLGDGAVRNDFSIADSHYYIVTGANMAGKSTFLRSLGVNYVLAMNGMPVFAERMRVSPFSLFSSMRTSDDLAHGISYFNAELLRLRRLIDHCHRQRRTLIILDEILKGTNSLDKLNGSRMFLDAITQLPVTGIIATHDLELSRMADERPDRFHNFCFEIKLSDEITYTYLITPGVARNQNATYLLKRIIEEV